MLPSLRSLFLLAAGLCHAAPSAQASPVTDKPSFPTVSYWDSWTDTKGVSHLTNCKLSNFHQTLTAPGADNLWTGTGRTGTATVLTRVQPPKWKGGWHETRQVEWIVPLSGIYFVQAMDGTRVELNPGDILLSEDQNTIRDQSGHVGHLSGNVGDSAVAIMVTQFANSKASHVQCSHP